MSLPHDSNKPVPDKGDILHGVCQGFLDKRPNTTQKIWMSDTTPWINDDGSFLIDSLPTPVYSGIFVQTITMQNPHLDLKEEESIVSIDKHGRLKILCRKKSNHLDFLPSSFMTIGEISSECSASLVDKLIEKINNRSLQQIPPPAADDPQNRKGIPIPVIENEITMRLN